MQALVAAPPQADSAPRWGPGWLGVWGPVAILIMLSGAGLTAIWRRWSGNVERLRRRADLAGLLRRLGRSGDTAYRVALIAAIQDFDQAEASEALLECIKDPDPEVRNAAIEALAARKDARAVPIMGRMVSRDDVVLPVRERLVVALGKIGGHAVVAPLRKAWITADWLMRGKILRAIGASGDPAAPVVIEALLALPEQRDSGPVHPQRALAYLRDDAVAALAASRGC